MYLRLFKSKKVYFLLPLEVILDKESLDEINELSGSKNYNKIYPVNKLSTTSNDPINSKLATMYFPFAEANLHGLFNNIMFISFYEH